MPPPPTPPSFFGVGSKLRLPFMLTCAYIPMTHRNDGYLGSSWWSSWGYGYYSYYGYDDDDGGDDESDSADDGVNEHHKWWGYGEDDANYDGRDDDGANREPSIHAMGCSDVRRSSARTHYPAGS